MAVYTFAVYNPTTGEIEGRVMTNSEQVRDSYPHRIDLDLVDFSADLEKSAMVDIRAKRLKRTT